MNHESTDRTQPASKTKLVMLIVAALLVVAASVTWYLLARPSPGSGSATPQAGPVATEAKPAEAPSNKSAQRQQANTSISDSGAKRLIEEALIAATVGGSDEGGESAAISRTSAGDFLEEVLAQRQEFVANGWRVTGKPAVVKVQADAKAADKNSATVSTCVDLSHVTLLDSSGDVIAAPGGQSARALHIFDLQLGKDNTWRVTGHSFPDDPKC